jgi:hypothetical protein
MILHFSQIGFTDALTFIFVPLLVSPSVSFFSSRAAWKAQSRE